MTPGAQQRWQCPNKKCGYVFDESASSQLFLKPVYCPSCSEEMELRPIKFDLNQMQVEVAHWAERNFGKLEYWKPLLGVMEELGELSHAVLKQEQGIRGTHDEHEEEARDAVGDITVFLVHLCTVRGWHFETIVRKTWDKVKQRNWRKDSENGGE